LDCTFFRTQNTELESSVVNLSQVTEIQILWKNCPPV